MNKKRRTLLAKLENILIAISDLKDDVDLGQGSLNKINQIKNKVDAFVENINNVRKKAKEENNAIKPKNIL